MVSSILIAQSKIIKTYQMLNMSIAPPEMRYKVKPIMGGLACEMTPAQGQRTNTLKLNKAHGSSIISVHESRMG